MFSPGPWVCGIFLKSLAWKNVQSQGGLMSLRRASGLPGWEGLMTNPRNPMIKVGILGNSKSSIPPTTRPTATKAYHAKTQKVWRPLPREPNTP